MLLNPFQTIDVVAAFVAALLLTELIRLNVRDSVLSVGNSLLAIFSKAETDARISKKQDSANPHIIAPVALSDLLSWYYALLQSYNL